MYAQELGLPVPVVELPTNGTTHGPSPDQKGCLPVNDACMAAAPGAPPPAAAMPLLKPLLLDARSAPEPPPPPWRLRSQPDSAAVVAFVAVGALTCCLVAVLCMTRTMLQRHGSHRVRDKNATGERWRFSRTDRGSPTVCAFPYLHVFCPNTITLAAIRIRVLVLHVEWPPVLHMEAAPALPRAVLLWNRYRQLLGRV